MTDAPASLGIVSLSRTMRFTAFILRAKWVKRLWRFRDSKAPNILQSIADCPLVNLLTRFMTEHIEMARVLVTNFHPIGGGGHVPYIQAITEITKVSGHVVGVAAPASSRIYEYLKEIQYPYLYDCNFPAKVQKESLDILLSIKKFRKVVSDFKPDIVHANGGPDLFISVWSYIAYPPYKIVRTHHAIKHIANDIYHRWLYGNRVAENVYVCKSAFELATEKGLIPSNNIIIENGVDLKRFQPIPKDMSLAEKYGIDEKCFCFGSCAGTGHYKRVDLIIKAATQLKNEGLSHFKILVLGDESSAAILRNMAKEKGVDNFIYCGFHKEIESLVSLFDVGFILSDSIETISYAAREMLAMGKPLISSSYAGLKENVRDGFNGVIVRPGFVDDVMLAMKSFLEMDQSGLKLFSLNARNHALEFFDIEKQKEQHIALYSRVESCN